MSSPFGKWDSEAHSGGKKIRTDEPSEHVDTKILETLVERDAGQQLPLGLRVDSYVQSEEGMVVK